MKCLRSNSLLVFGAVIAFTVTGVAQMAPPAGGGGGRPRGPRPAPTNLQVLPKTMTGEEVIKVMHQFTGDLGVECEFCHAQSPETHRLDFASDANPMKNNARVMMRMTHEIDTKYLAELSDHKDTDMQETCGTCHRGEAHPPAFVPKPEPRRGGPPPAAAPPR